MKRLVLTFVVALLSAREARADEAPTASGEEPMHFAVRPVLSGNYQSLYGSSVYTGEAVIGLGGASKWFGISLGAGIARGATGSGLGVHTEFLSAEIEGAIGRLRIGGETRFGSYAVHRVTQDIDMTGIYLGQGVHGSYDVARYGDRAVLLGAAFRVEPLPGNNVAGPLVFGPSVFVGARL